MEIHVLGPEEVNFNRQLLKEKKPLLFLKKVYVNSKLENLLISTLNINLETITTKNFIKITEKNEVYM